MQVVEAPPLAPGECALTKTSVGPFIDTLLDDDSLPHGRIYVSKAAVETMANLFGMASELAHDRLKARVERLKAELEETQQQLARERELTQAFIAAGYKEPAHVS